MCFRVSVSHATVPALVFGMLQPLIVVLLLAFILSSVLAHRLSEKIVEPLSAIDLDKPLENNTYDELAPVLSHIEKAATDKLPARCMTSTEAAANLKRLRTT